MLVWAYGLPQTFARLANVAAMRPHAERARLSFVRADPHVALAVAAVSVIGLEYGYRTWTSDAWLLLEAAVAGAGLFYAWRRQDRLRLAPLLGLALAFHGAWIALHLGLDVRGDVDTRTVFRRQGDSLLAGNYPHSEYPVGAVLLFAFESWVSGGATRTANAIVMIPFQLASAWAVWSTRTRLARWLAAVVSLWPLNAFSWEFKFDLVPTALLAVGLVLALRGRWSLAGIALGAGALVKWTPGLAFLALLAWLFAARRTADARRHAVAFVATVAVVYVPFLLWDPGGVGAAYSRQGGRAITAESVWYLVLHPFGLAHLRSHISFGAGAPGWATPVAAVIQALLVLAVVGAAARARSVAAAVALAAIAPVAFLLTNRIFSPQFMVLVTVALALAGALVLETRRQQLALGVGICAATLANAFVYPFALPHYALTWQLASAALFGAGLAATGWLALRALAAERA